MSQVTQSQVIQETVGHIDSICYVALKNDTRNIFLKQDASKIYA